jgi:hypothetical protein
MLIINLNLAQCLPGQADWGVDCEQKGAFMCTKNWLHHSPCQGHEVASPCIWARYQVVSNVAVVITLRSYVVEVSLEHLPELPRCAFPQPCQGACISFGRHLQ